MGQLKSDGRATLAGMTWPAGVITFGDLYRLNGWTGIAMKSIAAADVDRNADMEIAPDRIWYVKLPAGVAGTLGQYLYWTTAAAATFQRGDTNLTVTAAGVPCCVVEEAKDANNYAAVRILNIGPSGA
jgi:hypothetical protein